MKKLGYTIYTLEEFEKEFPFKVGDKVIHSYTTDFIGTVVDIKFDDYIPYRVDIAGKICTCGTVALKSYKEMKEERNIILTLDKAKEWYNKGGDLKQVALQAFTEKELTKVDLPKTWEEFCENYPIKRGEFYINSISEIHKSTCSRNRHLKEDKNVCSSQESAEAHLAMMQLERLRDCWWGDWRPTPHQTVFAIKFAINGLSVYEYCSREFLSFKDRKTATEFLKCFKDLIEKAGDLI